MSMTSILLLVLIGLAAGGLGGMIGLGGGIILIPALILIMKLDQQTAQGTSIAVMLPPIGLFAVYNYYKASSLFFVSSTIIFRFLLYTRLT